MTDNTNQTKNGPEMVALGEKQLGRNRTTLIKIGVAFAHKDGQGYNLEIDRLPLDFNGRIVLLPAGEDAERGAGDTSYTA